MTKNEQNFINKINEQQVIIEWQRKAILEYYNRIKELEAKDKLKNCEECFNKVSLVLKLKDKR